MNRLIKSTTALSMSLALAMPTHVTAQADFPDCQLDGSQLLFPCVVEREVFRQPEELATLIENRGVTSEDTQTTTTEQDGERIIAPSAQEETEAARIAAEQAQAEEAARSAAEQAQAEEAARMPRYNRMWVPVLTTRSFSMRSLQVPWMRRWVLLRIFHWMILSVLLPRLA